MTPRHDRVDTSKSSTLSETLPPIRPATSGRKLTREIALRPPILLLGSGRCGSTLLQRVLNSSPEITVWGEHAGFLTTIAESYFTLTGNHQAKRNFRNSRVPYQVLIGEYLDHGESINWVNPFDSLHVQICFRQFLLKLFARDLDPRRIHWGFKEILYGHRDRVIEMWQELFPETRYVFMVRNPYHVIRSMLLAWHRDKVEGLGPAEMESLALNCARRWCNANQGILQWTRQLPERSMLLRYEEVVKEKEASVNRLFEFLNIPTPQVALVPLGLNLEHTGGSRLGSQVDVFLAEKRGPIDSVIGEMADAFSYRI